MSAPAPPSARSSAPPTHRHHRWRDGDNHPHLRDDRGGYPRASGFKDSKKDLLNNGDLFSITQGKMISDIHRRFLEAGADIIETNTFSATSIGQSEFFVDDPREHGGRKRPGIFTRRSSTTSSSTILRGTLTKQSARQCREWADRVANKDGKQRFVAGRDRGRSRFSLSNSPGRGRRGVFAVVTFDQVEKRLTSSKCGR